MDDEHPDKEAVEEEPTVLRSGRVRIIGAEPVGGDVATPSGSEPAADEPPEEAELPHWTEAPTGEVPAVLARGSGDQTDGGADPWSSMPAPTWREEQADWTAQEETFEPSMLAQNEARLGSLDDSGRSDRQPWSFDLDSPDVDDRAEHDQDTMVVPVVRRPLAPEEPEEVAFRFDEADRIPPGAAVPETTAPGAAVPGTTAMPSTDAEPEPPVTAAPEPRQRRGGRGLGRSPRRRGETRPLTQGALSQDPATDAVADDLVDEAPAPSPTVRDRPVPEAPPVPQSSRPVPEAPPAPQSQSSRPVPQAPPVAHRRPPRPRPGSGLYPPSPTRESRGDRNLPVAVASGLVLGIIALVFFKLGTITSLIVVTAVVTLAAVEAYAAFRKAGYHPATLLGLVATVSLMVATYNKGQEALPLVLVLVFAFTMLWHLARVDPGAEPVRSTASTLLVFCWIGVFGSFAALLLDPTLFPSRHGIAFLLGAVVTAVAYDVGALAVGAWIGSHPLSEASPNKTWEGLAGGAVASVVAAVVVLHFVHPWTAGAAFALGVVVAVVSPIGDLSESLVKRHLGLKDMGRILPGHGGLLDRVDGMLFVLPATYYLVKAFHLG